MSAITKMLFPAVFIIMLCGVATPTAFALEDPYYKLAGGRLKAGEAREVGLKAEGNQTLVSKTSGITVTCTGIEAKAGATINGSEPGEPGTSLGVLEYLSCTVFGNGEKCIITSVKGAKDKRIVTNAVKSELELNGKEFKKGTKLLYASGPVASESKFEPETGGKCNFPELLLEGSLDFEILNSKKETVAFEEHEAEEGFGFIKPLPGGTEACKLREGKLDKCAKSSLKALGGFLVTVEGIAEARLTSKALFGVFDK